MHEVSKIETCIVYGINQLNYCFIHCSPFMGDIRMLIPVVYLNYGYGVVLPRNLDELIKSRMIIAFKRSSGWVIVDKQPIRSYDDAKSYKGAERQEITK